MDVNVGAGRAVLHFHICVQIQMLANCLRHFGAVDEEMNFSIRLDHQPGEKHGVVVNVRSSEV